MTTDQAPSAPARPAPRHRRTSAAPAQPTTAPVADELVVTVSPTIMDGLVVRWYRSIAEALDHQHLVSASRNGVLVHDFLHEVPPAVLTAATDAFEALRDRRYEGRIRSLATHRRRFGTLTPIVHPDPAPQAAPGDDRGPQ